MAAVQDTEQNTVRGVVLEPCRIAAEISMQPEDAADFQVEVSDVRMNLSPDVLELALSLQTTVLEPFISPPADKYVPPSRLTYL